MHYFMLPKHHVIHLEISMLVSIVCYMKMSKVHLSFHVCVYVGERELTRVDVSKAELWRA